MLFVLGHREPYNGIGRESRAPQSINQSINQSNPAHLPDDPTDDSHPEQKQNILIHSTFQVPPRSKPSSPMAWRTNRPPQRRPDTPSAQPYSDLIQSTPTQSHSIQDRSPCKRTRLGKNLELHMEIEPRMPPAQRSHTAPPTGHSNFTKTTYEGTSWQAGMK